MITFNKQGYLFNERSYSYKNKKTGLMVEGFEYDFISNNGYDLIRTSVMTGLAPDSAYVSDLEKKRLTRVDVRFALRDWTNAQGQKTQYVTFEGLAPVKE